MYNASPFLQMLAAIGDDDELQQPGGVAVVVAEYSSSSSPGKARSSWVISGRGSKCLV